ncbi:Ig-like domain-containing protein [Flagellimonas allohymeniacidonis]|uniref:Cadherin domain-containing protein n=1 Tax=Flagellimonas allohymeniacidonis TaxID=2517819 RepID=A0A4Q8QF01_9FLAO|nr:Ig-like domain-containing protein [Allomuricauda hymeniacidonis]TAI48237.1 hypothetical protein EW142_00025 [Allomuricauda hymeniacidonis]
MKNQIFPALLSLFLLFFLSCSSDSGEETPQPDTQAPTVDFNIAGATSSGSTPIVVSNEIIINVDARDAGGVAKVEAFIDDQKVGEDTSAPYQIVIDVTGFESKLAQTSKFKNYTLKITVTDTSGNTSSKEQLINIENKTPLITINFPPNQPLNSDIVEFYVFASSLNGEVLGIERVQTNDTSIILSTTASFSSTDMFMLTFAELNDLGIARFSTISNLTTGSLPEINLDTYPQYELRPGNQSFQATGFDTLSDIVLSGFGIAYIASIDYSSFNSVQIDRFECVSCDDVSSDFLYLTMKDSEVPYRYLTLDWDTAEDFIFTPNLFTDQGLENRTIQMNKASGLPIDYTNFRLVGYFGQNDFENNFYHLIDTGKSSAPDNLNSTYIFNDIFDQYSYEVTIDGYYTNRIGIPVSSVTTLDWTLDYTVSERNISIEKNSTNEVLGKVILGSQIVDANYIPYSWELIFDSQLANEVNIPEIPEEIKSWEFYDAFSTRDLQVRQVEIKRYENIIDFNDYLEKIISSNKRPFSVSNTIESIFLNSESNIHGAVDDWLVD